MNNIEKSHSSIKINSKMDFILVNTIATLIESNNTLNSYHSYKDNKTIEGGALNSLDQIKILMDTGINPFTPLKDSYTTYVDTVILLANRKSNSEALDLIVNYIKKEHIKALPEEILQSNVRAIMEHDNKYIEPLFEKGFILKQPEKEKLNGLAGRFIENANLAFFEALYFYQPEFNFNKKYLDEVDNTEKTLLDYTKDVAEYENEANPNSKFYRDLKNLENFIGAVALHTEMEKNTPEKRREIIKKAKI